jgi:hypothetical protein
MTRITAVENITLDGVMQAPGHPEEDTRDGFTRCSAAASSCARCCAPAHDPLPAQRLPAHGVGPPPDNLDEIMRDVDALNDEMRAAGVWVFAGGLHPPDTATIVRDELTTDGPFIEAKEHLGGFTVIDVPDAEAALDWARRLSRATTLPIESRPFAG